MNNVLKKSYIGDICDINLSTYSLSENWKFVNYLDTGNITKNKIENVQYIDLSVDKLPSRARRKVKQNNIIYSTVRPNQMHYGIIKRKLPENFLVSTGFAVLEIDSTQADPCFVYYYLTQDVNTEALHAIAEQSTSAYPSIKPSDIGNREILLPPLETQEKIAKVLSAIDDKIELNNSINNNLEQQAQAIFKSWFVDFEPFGGVMPDDWKLGKLDEISNITSGKRPAQKSKEKNKEMFIPIIGASYTMGYTNDVLYNEKILVTGRVGTHGIVQKISFPCWTSDNTLVVKSDFYEYIYQILKTIDYASLNRGSTQPLITQTDLKNIEIIIPNNKVLTKFEHLISSLTKMQNQINKENEQLAQLRDTLLPKLMSGEIDVSKVEIDDILENQSEQSSFIDKLL